MNRLAFVVVEDVLLSAGRTELDLELARFFALNAATPGERARRALSLAMDLPAYALSRQVNERLTDELAAKTYARLSLDRVRVLGRLACDEVVRPRLRPEAPAFLARLRADGWQTVALSALPEPVVAPLLSSLGVNELVANKLASARGHATGEFAVPGASAPERAARAREVAIRFEAALPQASAWASRFGDRMLLSAVGHPRVVRPEAALATLAAERGWQSEVVPEAG